MSSGTSYIRRWHTLTDPTVRAIATWRMSRRTDHVSANELSASLVRRHQRPTMLGSWVAESVVHARSAHLRNASSHLDEQPVVISRRPVFGAGPLKTLGQTEMPQPTGGQASESPFEVFNWATYVTWCSSGSPARLNKTKLFIKQT